MLSNRGILLGILLVVFHIGLQSLANRQVTLTRNGFELLHTVASLSLRGEPLHGPSERKLRNSIITLRYASFAGVTPLSSFHRSRRNANAIFAIARASMKFAPHLWFLQPTKLGNEHENMH